MSSIIRDLDNLVDSFTVSSNNKGVCIIRFAVSHQDSTIAVVSYILGSLTFIGKSYPFMFKNIKSIKTLPFLIVSKQNKIDFIVSNCYYVKSEIDDWIGLIQRHISENNDFDFLVVGGCGGPIVWVDEFFEEMWIYTSPKDSILVHIFR